MKEKNREVLIRFQIDNIPKHEDKTRIDENGMKGTSNRMSPPPIAAITHYLAKGEFEDSIRLRTGMEPRGMAEKCACEERMASSM